MDFNTGDVVEYLQNNKLYYVALNGSSVRLFPLNGPKPTSAKNLGYVYSPARTSVRKATPPPETAVERRANAQGYPETPNGARTRRTLEVDTTEPANNTDARAAQGPAPGVNVDRARRAEEAEAVQAAVAGQTKPTTRAAAAPPTEPTVDQVLEENTRLKARIVVLEAALAELHARLQDPRNVQPRARATTARAPAGGLIWNGKIYGGGQFIPRAAADALVNGEL